jgi:hypothetical protein
MHRNRSAEPDQGNLYLELDHSGYPVGKQCESRIGDKRPDSDEEGLNIPVGRYILHVSTRITEPEEARFDDSNPGQMAEYVMTEFVQYDTGKGERSD